MVRIFVSHPYIDNPEGNYRKVNIICKNLVKQGHIPISPLHLFSFYDDDSDRDEIMAICYHLIDCADELWSYGDSEGCRQERDYAECIGIPVRRVSKWINC
jgi:hypothetical protein